MGEAVKILADIGLRGEYDFYAYMEGDIEIPATTFEFWQEHVHALWRNGYFLQPYRIHSQGTTNALTDCFCLEASAECVTKLPDGPCGLGRLVESTCGAGHNMQTRSVYIHPRNPYSASFLLNKERMQEYLLSQR